MHFTLKYVETCKIKLLFLELGSHERKKFLFINFVASNNKKKYI